MAKYKGTAVTVNHPAQQIFDKVSDFSTFQERIDQLPDDARQKLPEVRFTTDTITINAPAVGELTFKVVELVSPVLMRMVAENAPVPINININLTPVSDESTEVVTELDVEIPAMLRPLIGNRMQEAADKFGKLFGNLFGN